MCAPAADPMCAAHDAAPLSAPALPQSHLAAWQALPRAPHAALSGQARQLPARLCASHAANQQLLLQAWDASLAHLQPAACADAAPAPHDAAPTSSSLVPAPSEQSDVQPHAAGVQCAWHAQLSARARAAHMRSNALAPAHAPAPAASAATLPAIPTLSLRMKPPPCPSLPSPSHASSVPLLPIALDALGAHPLLSARAQAAPAPCTAAPTRSSRSPVPACECAPPTSAPNAPCTSHAPPPQTVPAAAAAHQHRHAASPAPLR
mmetsp:Transcript_50185/g.83160  ORF Transcript_50185/g.83160 Transcript_50185/m.83160 type:complete len:263 (-) Transcript_50185:775-1563(-)